MQGVGQGGRKEERGRRGEIERGVKREVTHGRVKGGGGGGPADRALVLLEEPGVDALLVVHVHAG